VTIEVSSARNVDLGVSDLERVEAVFTNPDLYGLADGVSVRDPTKGGRPQVYPDYLVEAFGALRSIYKSARAAATALHGPLVWEHIRAIVRSQCPEDASKWLPETPPCRTWYVKRKKQIERDGLGPLSANFTTSGISTAEELGLLDPDCPGTKSHPDPSRLIHHDGKAIKQMFNGAPGDTRQVQITNPETGEFTVEERPVRADPDAEVHISGDNRQVHGSKFWHGEVRDDDRFTRVILVVDHVPSEKGKHNSEADIAVKNLLALAPRVPGALGTVSDTALRGTHLNTLQRATGWVIINPVTAETVDRKTGERTEKEYYLRTVTFTYDDGTSIDVEIWTSGGRLCQVVYADDGTRVLDPLRRIASPVRANLDGTFRTYVEYEVADPRGIAPVTVMEATYDRQEDKDGLNRAENVRQIPPGDPDYQRLMGRRSDAESANRQIDDNLYLRRAASIGANGQLFDLICHAFVINSVARARHRKGARSPNRAAAA
jgi:hypothetical protein